jgi:hypothetical protein
MAQKGIDVMKKQALPDRLKEATRPAMVATAPGKFVPYKTESPPDVSLCTWQANSDGTFTPIPHTERMVRLNRRLARFLGFTDRYDTLLRLGRAGFVELVQISPHYTLMNLDSWFNHLRRCAEDADFWDKQRDNYKEYCKSIF